MHCRKGYELKLTEPYQLEPKDTPLLTVKSHPVLNPQNEATGLSTPAQVVFWPLVQDLACTRLCF